MLRKSKSRRADYKEVLNKDFFGYLSGFFGLIFTGLVFVFIAGYYKVESVNSVKSLEAKAPLERVGVKKEQNSSSVLNSFESASSTFKKK